MLNRIIHRMVYLENIFGDSGNTKSNTKTRMLNCKTELVVVLCLTQTLIIMFINK